MEGGVNECNQQVDRFFCGNLGQCARNQTEKERFVMNFFNQWGRFMMMGARALAKWEIDNSNTILRDRKRGLIRFVDRSYHNRGCGFCKRIC